jgi:hypothetical protein
MILYGKERDRVKDEKMVNPALRVRATRAELPVNHRRAAAADRERGLHGLETVGPSCAS